MKTVFSRALIFLALFAVTAGPSAAENFSDISASSYQTAIQYGLEKSFFKGYADGTFRPEAPVNRAEFLALLITAKLGKAPDTPGKKCFSDMAATDWFAPFVCHAKKYSLAKGYPDGKFHPEKPITVVEAAKIFTLIFKLPFPTSDTHYWFLPYLQGWEKTGLLLPSFSNLTHSITRAETAEVLWRIKEAKTKEKTIPLKTLLTKDCTVFVEAQIPHVNMEKVRAAWLSWLNGARAKAGLAAYSYNDQLIRSAFTWSKTSADRDTGTHKRPGQTAYYDYNRMVQWFADLGLKFANVHRVTFTENIGWWPFHCTADDCTDEMIAAMRHTFDFYMAEKGKASSAHYDSVMNGYFREIGMSIAVSKSGKMYITTHYDTAITSNPEPICPMIN